MRAVVGQTRSGVLQLEAHAGELEPVRLLGVQAQEARLDLGQRLQVALQRIPQLGRDLDDAHRGGEVRAQLADQRQRTADAVLVLEREHLVRGLRADVGVPVAIAADPAAEAQRASRHGRLEAEALEFLGKHLEDVGHRVAVELVEVVDGVACLVDHVGTDDAQLVRLPQQVDQLLQPPGDAPLGRRVSRGMRALVEQHGHVGDLGQDRPSRRFGGMRGEDRPHGQPRELLGQLAGRHLGRRDAVHGLGQPPALGCPQRRELAAPVHLLRDVGQVEVHEERAHQLRGRIAVELRQQRGGGLAVRANQLPDVLHQTKQLMTLLPNQRTAEQVTQLPDIASERSLGIDWVVPQSSERNQVTARGIAWIQLLTWSKPGSSRTVTSPPARRSRSTDRSASA